MKEKAQLLLIRPACFFFNEETAASNAFQNKTARSKAESLKLALKEFDALVNLLKKANIPIQVIQDSLKPETPDAIFPNNWFSTHSEGRLVVYPMESKNRRKEVSEPILTDLKARYPKPIDLREDHSRFLEGTGSLVLDRKNNWAFLARSSRSNETLAREWANLLGYQLLAFDAVDSDGLPIYHSNVMISIAEDYVLLGLECIASEAERQEIKAGLKQLNKEIIALSQAQIAAFAANVLEVRDAEGQKRLLLSKTAHASLTSSQLKQIERFSKPLVANVSYIEQVGGGGLRCMLAELV